jgi:hypothetical protein
MKIKLLSIVLVIMAVRVVSAQKKGSLNAGSSSTPGVSATPPTSSSGSSSLVQGYHYILPKNYHVAYRSILYMSPNVIDTTTGKLNKHITYIYFVISTTNPFVPDDIQQINAKADSIQLSLQMKGLKKTNKNSFASILNVGNLNTPDTTAYKGWAKVVIDTLWRYSDKRQRVSLTQGDSGKVVVQFHNKPQGLEDRTHKVSIHETIRLLSKKLPPPKPMNPDTFVKYFIRRYVASINIDSIDIRAYNDHTGNAAIPIRMTTDSAQNFYLKIRNKVHFDDPIYYRSISYSVWQYGATTIPFRYRFANSKLKVSLPNAAKVQTDYPVPAEATGNISFAAYIGEKFGATRFFYDATKSHNTVSVMFSAFGGPTLVPLSANNIKSGADINAYPSQLLSFSYGAACTFEFGVLNLGFFGGIDQPIQKSPWVYAGKPWIGFGFGFNLGMLTSAGNIGLN